ncbi:MAG: F0F1 ATP synthase subunit B [Defluviitaleaceae bacterium]|nr:F0F1 ATP synthase subunit B [Defluviitaleaceae bacterium]
MNPQIMILLNSVPEYRELFSVDLQTFIDMIPPLFSFIVLVVLLTFLLYKPVKKVLQARAERVVGELAEAEDKNATAHELKSQYEQKIRDIDIECTAMIGNARIQAYKVRDKIINDAKIEAQEVRNRAANDVAFELNRVKGEVHHAIIDISTEMAEKLMAVTIDKSVHDSLFDEAMNELEAVVFQPLNTL